MSLILWIVLFDFNSCPSYLYAFIFCKKAFWQFTCSWCPCFLQVDVSRRRLFGGGMYPKSFCELNCTLDGFFCNISWIYQHPKIPPGHLFVQQSYPALAFLTWPSLFLKIQSFGSFSFFSISFCVQKFSSRYHSFNCFQDILHNFCRGHCIMCGSRPLSCGHL